MSGRGEPRIRSFCSGVGGLELAVADVFGGSVVDQCEIDDDASKVLAARFAAPNLGDLTTVPWEDQPPADILCAGFPCQPVSLAGRRAGTSDDRWLFDGILDAVGRMVPRPRLLVFENVRGLLSANGGDALADVVQGLAGLGFVGRYGLLRASDVGACHQRARWFCVAHTVGEGREGTERLRQVGLPADGRGAPLDPDDFGSERGGQPRRRRLGPADDGRATAPDAGGAAVGPEPVTVGRRGGQVVARLDRQAAADADDAGHGGAAQEPARQPRQRHGATDGDLAPPDADGFGGGACLGDVRAGEPDPAGSVDFGPYAPAVERWERTLGRRAPSPHDDARRLNPVFVEWMMGYPAGWVTDLLPRRPALRCLGNAVVRQQAAAAIRALAPFPAVPLFGDEGKAP